MGDIVDKLTPREKQVMLLKSQGLSEKQIARRLGIAYSTVKTYSARARVRTDRTTMEIVAAVLTNA